MPRIIFVHRSVADEILKGTGHTLDELQKNIDSKSKIPILSYSGKEIENNRKSKPKSLSFTMLQHGSKEVILQLRKEMVVFSGHADHVGRIGEDAISRSRR